MSNGAVVVMSTLLGGRACPEVAFLREFEEICVSFWLLGGFRQTRVMTGVCDRNHGRAKYTFGWSGVAGGGVLKGT